MRFHVTADSDIGTTKNTNQDSVLVKHAQTSVGEVVMAIVCDGMGGLAKGELASATVVKEFASWFDHDLPYELDSVDIKVIGAKWRLMIKDLNVKILDYGKKTGVNLGTTFSGILILDNKYIIAHVGDSRVYYIGTALSQLTEDQTVIARELKWGTVTPEQARTESRRNILLQCVGASKNVEPQILYGQIEKGAYMLCSDGFRHEITEKEIYESLKPLHLTDKHTMHHNIKYLIHLAKERKEKDNISVILVKVD